MSALPPLALYIHIPWCVRKCPYCDFNSHAVSDLLPEMRYIAALLADFAQDLQHFQPRQAIRSIFFGGGTPSLLQAENYARLLEEIRRLHPIAPDVEITLEANPGTVDCEKFAAYRALGINRLSIGAQSFQDRLLQHIGRIHRAADTLHAFERAREAGFGNINLDLMYGLPDCTLTEAEEDVRCALALAPEHLSYYQLTLEPHTFFHRHPPPLPDEEQIDAMQRTGRALLAAHGYRRYEISAYSLPGLQCRHNVNYWQFGDYLGIGAGAHGKISVEQPERIIRYWKRKHPDDYLSHAATAQRFGGLTTILPQELPLEFLMNQLRLREGFTLATYQARTGLAPETLSPALERCMKRGWLIADGERIHCTEQGWEFLDSVLQVFL